ncbi:FtsK/SpoIIIE domain-containing protein [Arthrobacter woluwensis]|uniref:FtsK/SpoIIIE domain-containing protein n=1 Tax=Arthrobacter woluwensis TaxID=156980 RepID=UPI0038033C2D
MRTQTRSFTEPTIGLKPRPARWPKKVFTVAVLTVAAAGWQVVTKQQLLVPTFLLGAAVIGAVIVFGLRQTRQEDLYDRFVEAISSDLGSGRPLRSMVRVSHWKGWPTGAPSKMSLRYASQLNPEDPKWKAGLTDTAERIFGIPYEIVGVGIIRGRVHLRAKAQGPVKQEEEIPEVVRRAESIVEKAFAAGAKAKIEQDPEGEIAAIDVDFAVDRRLAKLFNRLDVDSTITSLLKGKWRSFWDLENDHVRYERRKPLPGMVPHPAPEQLDGTPTETYDDVRIPLGVDEDGNTLYWVPAINPHFLVVGTSGSGKTVLMHGLLSEFAFQGWPCFNVDGKGTEFVGYKRWPNVVLVGSSALESVRVVHHVHGLMDQRRELIKMELAREEDFEPILLSIDEFKAWKHELMRDYRKIKVKGDPTEPEAIGLVSDIASMGRSVRVHLLIGLQRPDAAFLSGDMRDNFAARASMGRLSRDGAQMMWNDSRTGTSLPRKARGRAITTDAEGHPVEAQVYWTPDPRRTDPEKNPENHAILEALRPRETTHPRMQIVEPDPTPDIEGDGTPEITYWDWAEARLQEWSAEYEEARRAALRLRISQMPTGKRAAERRAVIEDDADAEEKDWDLEYSEAQQLTPDDIEAGDLVCLDEDNDVWVTVEDIYPSEEDDDSLALDWRTDDDQAGTDILPTTAVLPVRKLIDNAKEQDHGTEQ